MAQAQRLRVKHSEQAGQVQTKTQARLSPAQVTSCVNAALDCVLGTVAYHRGLFPSDRFELRCLKGPHSAFPSQQRSSGLSASSSSQEPSNNQLKAVRKLKKGLSPETDLLMGYVDGAKEAIERGYLAQLTLFVLQDPEKPDEYLESYAVKFAYHGDDLQVSLETPQTASLATFPGSLAEMRQGCFVGPREGSADSLRFLSELHDEMTNTCLSELPARRYIDLKLDYNDSAPMNYHPNRFRPFMGKLLLGNVDATFSSCSFSLGAVQVNTTGVSVSVLSALFRRKSHPQTVSTTQDSDCHLVQPDHVFASLPDVQEVVGRVGEREARNILSTGGNNDTQWPEDMADNTQASHQTLAQVNIVTEFSSSGTLARLTLQQLPSHGPTSEKPKPGAKAQARRVRQVVPLADPIPGPKSPNPKRATKAQRKPSDKRKTKTKLTATTYTKTKTKTQPTTTAHTKKSKRQTRQPGPITAASNAQPKARLRRQTTPSTERQRVARPQPLARQSSPALVRGVTVASLTRESSRMDKPINVSLPGTL